MTQSLVSRHPEPDPDGTQQYVDYMILEPPRSAARMQAPLLDGQVGADPLKHTLRSLFEPINDIKALNQKCSSSLKVKGLN